ncbi:hypothetical protein K8O68_16350 [Salipaludibacillus sp. CUR1]|uniref:hypothetical protein n=1 Tax=Salipaludibacillus sp. CUR1 TaxID=2820003 RepID=UPI001E3E20E2|nr:hypothetical protein [Salipaludibacillus sp. CUR1]MCE7793960.1 hypothetical protein [Salipaludibacillus sp. CUR1]
MIVMYDVWMLGPLMIPVITVVVLLSVIGGLLYLRYLSPYKYKSDYQVRDLTANTLILTAVIYFFGSVPLNFSAFVNDPVSILSYPSGQNEFFLAITAAIIYLVFKLSRQKVKVTDTLAGVFYVVLVADLLFAFAVTETGKPLEGGLSGLLPFTEHPVSLYTMGLSLIFLIWLHYAGRLSDVSVKLMAMVPLWAAGKWVISLTNQSAAFLTIYLEEHTYLVFAAGTVAAACIYYILRKKQVILWKN